jgi:hypothetical protein
VVDVPQGVARAAHASTILDRNANACADFARQQPPRLIIGQRQLGLRPTCRRLLELQPPIRSGIEKRHDLVGA